MSAESNVASALVRVRAEIAEAEREFGRTAGSARLLAVSKTKSVELIREAAAAGQVDFGENYAQEAAAKMDELPELRFHFIGALQTNKAKLVVGRAALIHSVDRAKLAREISEIANRAGVRQDVLLQLKIGDEESKAGASLDDALSMAEESAEWTGVRFVGTMCLPPLAESDAQARGFFREAREKTDAVRSALRRAQGALAADSFVELSMGTSHDFRAAIAEGATLVRVGTAIFGARD